MSEWIAVTDKTKLDSAKHKEVELAFWDGVCMNRTFGVFDKVENAWYTYGWPVDVENFTVTHWKIPDCLPDKPADIA